MQKGEHISGNMLRIALDFNFGVINMKGKTITVNRLIFAASNFGDFKRLAYLRRFNCRDFLNLMPFYSIFFSH